MFEKNIYIMAYPPDKKTKAPKKYSYIDSETGRTITMRKQQTLPSGKTVYAESFEKPKKTKYANPQRGVSAGNKKSQVGGARNKPAGNTSDSFQCTPTSKSKKCRPGGK